MMRSELFVLPEKTHKDFREAFVLTREEIAATQGDLVAFAESYGGGFDLWYDEACLWERMSPDMPRLSLKEALARLRGREGTVLFLSDSPDGADRGVYIFRGRPVTDFVAMVSAGELADEIEREWYGGYRTVGENGETVAPTLPDTLYVFDTTFEWVMVFTGELTAPGDADARVCMAFGI